MYEMDTKKGMPIEAVSAGCTFENVVIDGFVDISAIDWPKIVKA